MEILRSSESQFISCKGSSGASPSYLMDNFNANEAQAATTMADIFVLGSSVEPENQRQQAPKLEDFFGDSPSIVRYSDNSQAETQDSSLTHIYDHGPAAYFNEHQDLKAIIGFQAFSTNSGSEVDDSASIARSHISSNKILVHSIESTRNELVFSNWGVSNHGLSLGVDCSNKIADTFGQRTSIYRGITRHRWTGRYGAHPWDNSCRKEGLVRKERQAECVEQDGYTPDCTPRLFFRGDWTDTRKRSLPLLWSMSIIAFFFLLLLAPSSSTTTQGGPTKHRSGPTKHRIQEIVAQRGVVATDDGRCSNIATDILREGGHAVDAAVAAALCLGVVSSASSGIGGGAFMVVRTANGVAKAFDMREVAPASASQNMYAGNATLKASGVLSVAVPGELAGLHKAWELYGRLPWQRLVWPAERLARRGFRISPYLHMQMVKTQSGILADKGLRDIFTSSGRLLQPGDKCQNKKLAMTLKKIAKYGIQVFYNGSIGFNMVQDIQKAGGILTMEDLRRYQVKSREPVSSNFQDLKILSMPPPSSGGASMILILNILSLFGVPYGFSGPLGIHREIEALKHAFAVRMNLGDPDFVNVNEVLADMLSPEFAEKLKQTIFDNRTFDVSHYGGRWNQIHDHGTSHVSIIDKERNAVSMTNTVNSYFGAQILSPSTGIVMNNEMDDFSMSMNASGNVLPPAPPNFISPGKRPLSSMTPTIVLKNGQLKAVIGASGGVMIIAGTMEVFLNHFARGMDPLSSVLAPRVYHELIPNILYYENWTTPYKEHIEVSADVRAFLQERGHVIQGLAGGTICQFIVQDLESSQANRSIGELVGVSDPRKGGFPAGF